MSAPPPSGGRGRRGDRLGRGRPARRAAGALAGALAFALPQALSAQDDRPPGPLLAFDLSQRLQYDDNLGLTPGGEDDTLQAVTTLGFAVLSETRVRDVAFLRDLDDFVDEDGVIDLPDDFDDIEGEGIRQSVTVDAALSLRERSRSGVTLSAGLTDLRYFDVTSEELTDSRRVRLGAALRLTLNPAAEANLALGYSVLDDEADEEDSTTLSFDAGATISRPDGAVFGSVGVDETEDGTRASLSFGRSLDLPLGGVSGEIGVTRDASGDLNLTGDLSVARDLPRGGLAVALSQSVEQDSDDEERVVTTASLGYRRDLTPLASLSLDARYADSRATAEGEDVRSLSLGASASYAVTRDWSLSLGVSREMRDEEVEGRADNNSVFLALSRTFAGTF
jgi:hypothetical protein